MRSARKIFDACASTLDHNLGSATFSLFWFSFLEFGVEKYLPPNSLHWNSREFAVQTEYFWILSMTCR